MTRARGSGARRKPGQALDIDTEVIVVGSGPTGLVTASLLGERGVRVVLIEQNLRTVDEPRAVSIDDESLRTLQAVGAIEAVLEDVIPGYGSHYHAPDGDCFAKVEPTGTPFGYPRRNAFRQPRLEAKLRENLSRFASVTSLFGWTLTDFADRPEGVSAVVRDGSGTHRNLSAAFLVGCDGARSTVREKLGIDLGGTTFDERWMILDLEGHPNAERHTDVFCDPRRPCITLPGPGDTRRFEFKLLAGERDEDMLEDRRVAELLGRHGANPEARLRRKVVYRFHARVAPKWSRGRVFLAGDAAHLTPPFAGQGMNSGLRDAHNLAWKLAAVLGGRLGPRLLQTYEQERSGHVWQMIRLALRMGRVMAPRSSLAGWFTRAAFRLLRLYPPAHAYVLEMKYKPKPRFAAGFVAAQGGRSDLVGRLLPQPQVVSPAGRRVLLDELLGNQFCLVACGPTAEAALHSLREPIWSRLGVRRLAVAPGDPDHRSPPGDVELAFADPEALRTLGPEILLVRPDHYVAAAFGPGDAAVAAATLEALVEATWRDGPPGDPGRL